MRVRHILLELSLPGLADPGQVQVALSQSPSLQQELCSSGGDSTEGRVSGRAGPALLTHSKRL